MATTTTLSDLIDLLSQRIGDYKEETVTTAIAANTSVVCSTLANYTNRDDEYNRYWLYITDKANAGTYRKVSDYTASTGTLTVLGANLTSDGTDKATFQLHKYDRNNKIRAINRAARDTFPALFRYFRDVTLSGNNILPNPSFEDWTSTSYPDYCGVTNSVATEETTLIHGPKGSSAVKVTALANDGYMNITSNDYPQLLEIGGKKVTLRVWAYCQASNNASVEVRTMDSRGSIRSGISTTTSTAGAWKLIELKDHQTLDNLAYAEIRFSVAKGGTYVSYDNARLVISGLTHYLLPDAFQSPIASIDKVSYQVGKLQDYGVDDLMSSSTFEPLYGWSIENIGSYRYLVTPWGVPTESIIVLDGYVPLETGLSSATDTVTIQQPYTDLLIEYAAYCLFDMEAGLPSSQDRVKLKEEAIGHLATYNTLKKRLRMTKPQSQQRIDWRLL